MKLVWFFSLTVALTVSYVASVPTSSNKDVADHQAQVLNLYQNVGSEDTHDFVRKDFPYADPQYYTEPKVVENFMSAFKDGFLDKEGHFNLYSYKNRHDTYRLFDVFYFAKDFDTFIKIAKWAKSELNPLQFVHAFTAAIYHREDTDGVVAPPLFEVLPQYFTPSHVMNAAYRAMIHDVKLRKFEVNGTAYEYSWYQDQFMDKYKYGLRFNEYDREARMSYFREDVTANDWWSKFFLRFAPWISNEKYPGLHWDRRGEYMYCVMKWLLGKYNLERYANGLPPVEPINFHKIIKSGYNSQLSNIYGRPFISRPDSFYPADANPTGIEYLQNMYQRYLAQVESYSMINPYNSTVIDLNGVQGFEKFAKIFFGISSPEMRQFYRPLYFQALEAIDLSVKSSNDIGYMNSPVANYMTELRDPVFYQVLAYLDKLFNAYDSKKTPYTKQDIEFPGVKISSFDFSKLETYFERYEYEISNAIPPKGDAGKYKYLVSKWRMNHKPYTYSFNIRSEKETDATVKIFLAPEHDANYRRYGFNAFLKYGVGFDVFHVSLKSGDNKFERKSSLNSSFIEIPRFKHIVEQLQRSHGNQPISFTNNHIHTLPRNMELPRGSVEGTKFKLMVVVHPKGSSTSNQFRGFNTLQDHDDEHFFLYPLDRPSSELVFQVPNVYFSDITVYDATTLYM